MQLPVTIYNKFSLRKTGGHLLKHQMENIRKLGNDFNTLNGFNGKTIFKSILLGILVSNEGVVKVAGVCSGAPLRYGRKV